MTKELKQKIISAGLTITAATVGGIGGYFIAEQQPVIDEQTIINYQWEEKELVIMLWNKMLEAKKANCEAETDCEIIDGKPQVLFENINRENIGAKLDEKLGEYEIILKKKVK